MTSASTASANVICLAAWLVASAAHAEQQGFAARISELVFDRFPDAVVTEENGTFIAKHGTMVFAIHTELKTGEIVKEPRLVEGPNYKGFMISLSRQEGEHIGQAVVPQTLNMRYWRTYIDRPATEDGKGYYVIDFSYGSSLDQDFMKAVFDILPKATQPPTSRHSTLDAAPQPASKRGRNVR